MSENVFSEILQHFHGEFVLRRGQVSASYRKFSAIMMSPALAFA